MAHKVELPALQIQSTIGALIDAQALVPVDRDRYDLGARYPEHRRMLVESGRLMSGGKEAGRLSAMWRRSRLIGGE